MPRFSYFVQDNISATCDAVLRPFDQLAGLRWDAWPTPRFPRTVSQRARDPEQAVDDEHIDRDLPDFLAYDAPMLFNLPDFVETRGKLLVFLEPAAGICFQNGGPFQQLVLSAHLFNLVDGEQPAAGSLPDAAKKTTKKKSGGSCNENTRSSCRRMGLVWSAWSGASFLDWICTMQILHNQPITTPGEELDDLDNDLSDLSH